MSKKDLPAARPQRGGKSISVSLEHRSPKRRIKLQVTVGLGILAMPFLTQLPPLPLTFRGPPETQISQRFCAPFGDHLRVQLHDGSNIQLNSATCVATELSGRARLVKLEQGEAIFHVAADPSRPFVVKTGSITIQALGTQFDVYRKVDVDRKRISTRVAVIEGAVQVASPNTTLGTNAKLLTALEQLDFPDDTAQPMVSSITVHDFERMTAWTHGDIELENQTLKESLDEFMRYRHIQVVFKDKAIEGIRFGGDLHTDGLDSFVALLKFRCIRGEHDKAAHQLTLSTKPGKRAGTACR